MKKILVTGGCGFIGSNLIALLDARGGAEITVLDNETGGNRSALDGRAVTRFIKADVRDAQAVAGAIAGQDTVVHLAAQTSVVASVSDPEDDFSVNVAGGLCVLQAAKAEGVGRFIFASSAAPLGDQPPPIHEQLAAHPASPYGASKLAMEGYCSAFFHAYGLKTVCLRFSNAYGPGGDHAAGVVALFIRSIVAGQPLTVYGDGEQTRDFIHVDDLGRMIAAVIDHPGGDDVFGQVYQVGSGTETSVNALIALLQDLARRDGGRVVETVAAAARPGEIRRNYSDISRFLKIFGHGPEIALADGLATTWAAFERPAAERRKPERR